jgi:hypothetical protein
MVVLNTLIFVCDVRIIAGGFEAQRTAFDGLYHRGQSHGVRDRHTRPYGGGMHPIASDARDRLFLIASGHGDSRPARRV